MREIGLNQGRIALVDDDDYARLAEHRWFVLQRSRGGTEYAIRFEMRKGIRKSIWMHRVLLAVRDGLYVDHINGNGLDNRRANLRLATISQNGANRFAQSNNTSGFKGVFYNTGRGRSWFAQIKIQGRARRLGCFDDREAAARAYDQAAFRAFGEFARLNFPTSAFGA